MSIEDVEHLLKNSEQNSLSIFVDSRMRNLLAYPTPSRYVVDFEEPIKNVFGLEVLDVTIPVTEYTIDTDSCSLAISQVFLVEGVALEEFIILERTDTFATVNNISMLRMCCSIPMFMHFVSEPVDANFFICRNKQLFDDMNNVIPDEITSNMIIYVKNIRLENISEDPDVEHKYQSNQSNQNGDKWQITIESPFLIYAEWKYCLDDDAETYAIQFQTDEVPYDVFLCNKYMSVDVGNYDSTTLLTKMRQNFISSTINRFGTAADGTSNIKCNFTDDPDPGSTTLTQVLYFQSSHPFWFDMKKSTMCNAIGFSEYATTNKGSLYNTFKMNTAVNYQLFSTIEYTRGVHKVIAPGLVNIENARYVILRCPEIENHMLGSYASFKYAPGLGLLKLTETNTMMNLRFDFINIARRAFHPIGKLSRLTFSFEKVDGTLYDFKGVDHVMLLSLKYYSPKNAYMFEHSSLNPYYTPNIIKYLTDKKESGIKEDARNIEDLLIEQQKYM
jgi:hypothetical protein